MARDAGTGGGLKLTSGSIEVISKDSFEKQDENDLLTSLSALAPPPGTEAAELKVVDLSELDEFAPVVEEAEPEIATLIAQAARLYAQNQLSAAIEVLDRALEIDPESLDALWLKAGCLVRLGGREVEALRVLMKLRSDESPGRRALRAQLYAALRAQLVPKTMLTALLMLASGQTGKVIALASEFVHLDPEGGAYYALLAGALGMEERFDEALATLDRGLGEAHADEREQLKDLRETIRRRVANDRMSEARGLFLEGKYGRAQSALKRLEPSLGDTPLYRGFAGYLAQLGDGARKVSRGERGDARLRAAQPPGTKKEADSVYFFLVGDLVAEGRRHYEAEEFAAAAEVLERALAHCPSFPYANFLLGIALYSGIGKAIDGARPPDGATALTTMQRVHEALRIGCQDPDVGDVAKSVDRSVKELLDSVAANKGDADLINPVVSAFEEAMAKVGDGIESEKQLAEVLAAMREVKAWAAKISGRVRTDEGKQALATLTKRVDEAIAQLEDIEDRTGMSEELGRLIKLFNAAVTLLEKNPISSYSELETARGAFAELHEKTEKLRRKAKGSAAKKAGELLKAIENIERHLNRV